MIETWSSYSIADLVLFSSGTYARLFERANATAWPAYLALAAVLAWCLVGRWTRRGFIVAHVVLALSSWFVASWFFVVVYAPINPFARWAALAFAVQGALLLAMGLARSPLTWPAERRGLAAWPGALLVLYGLLVHPLTGWLDGRPVAGVELAGVAPDPTALVTIGLVLLSPRPYPWSRWVLLSIPFAWCLVSALTRYGLALASPFLPLVVALVAVAVAGPTTRVPSGASGASE